MVELTYQTNPTDLEGRLDRLMEAMVEAGVPDPDFTASLAEGKVTLMMGSDGGDHVAVCRELGCEYDLPTVPCDGCEARYQDDEDDS